MSRKTKALTSTISIHFGTDHALGLFLDISDTRSAKDGGEGYVWEHSDMFPADNSKIVIDVDEEITEESIIKACDEYINKLKLKNNADC